MAKYILQPLLSIVRTKELKECKGYSVGSDEKSMIFLPHNDVSNKHCIFVLKPEGLQVIDLKSKFGTFVNGKKIKPYTLLNLTVDDVIGISNAQTKNIDTEKPFVYCLKVEVIKEEDEEEKKVDLSGIPNKKMKIEEDRIHEIIDLTDDNDGPQVEKIDVKIERVDASTSPLINIGNEHQPNDKVLTNSNSSPVVRSFRKMIVYKDYCMKTSQQETSLLKKKDQESPSLESSTLKKQPSDRVTDTSIIIEQYPNKKYNLSYTDLIQIFEIKNEKEEQDTSTVVKQILVDKPRQLTYDDLLHHNKIKKHTIEQDTGKQLTKNLAEKGSQTENLDDDSVNQQSTAEVNTQIDFSTVMHSPLSEEQPYDPLDCLDSADFQAIMEIDLELDASSLNSQKTPSPVSENTDSSIPKFDNGSMPCCNQSDNGDDDILNIDEYTDIESEVISVSSRSDNILSSASTSNHESKDTSSPPGLPIEFLHSIFQWSPLWLDNYIYNQLDTQLNLPFRGIPVTSFPSSYNDYKDYHKNMTTMILRELWACAVRRLDGKRKKKNSKACGFILKNSYTQVTKNSKTVTEFEMDFTEAENIYIGDFVVLKLAYRSDIFAYVKSCIKFTDTQNNNNNDDNKCKRFKIVTKSLPGNIDCSKKNEIQVIYNIESFVRMAQSIECLKFSPLLPIIAPFTAKEIFLQSGEPNYAVHNFFNCDKLDDDQKKIVLRTTNAIVEDKPKICFIDGQPGTGKSHIIVNIVTEIINIWRKENREHKRTLLICASSNDTVNSIIMKLVTIHSRFKSENKCIPFRILCVGSPKSICSDVDSAIVQLAEIMNTKDDFTGTNVVVCLLSSCYSYEMEQVFGKGQEKISACFIDNASLYCEPESLIPLMLGIEKFVFVGNLRELPTSFYSDAIKKFNNHKSLISRIYEMLKFYNDNPVIKLNVQYRTSEDIFYWPNNYFYGRTLQTKVDVPKKWPLFNYKVFDYDSNETNDSYKTTEANFVVKLLNIIVSSNFGKVNDTIRVGVFVYSYYEKRIITRKWAASNKQVKNKKKIVVDIKTAGRIQEQEYEIIIMSCGRNVNLEFLTNEQRLLQIFTHVKYSLFICGDFKLFESDDIFKNLLQDARQRGLCKSVDYNNSDDLRRMVVLKQRITFTEE